MSTLYQISQTQCDQALVPLLNDGDSLILLGDACYTQTQWRQSLDAIAQGKDSIPIFVRQSDLEQRGLGRPVQMTVITDSEWVELSLSHSRTISWS
ncbi:MAG: hypothetical protein CMI09_07505 [Oceanospirillaceae bacterium]|nr:hypothetical protein [Oceanospirillaceae bacterium]|tara:strand:- start:1026 stop:1313 length:288 start_codon:yes stop_codon:yes gene_type:complete